MSDYKWKILETVREIKKAIKEDDQQHLNVLWHRLEIQILGKSYY